MWVFPWANRRKKEDERDGSKNSKCGLSSLSLFVLTAPIFFSISFCLKERNPLVLAGRPMGFFFSRPGLWATCMYIYTLHFLRSIQITYSSKKKKKCGLSIHTIFLFFLFFGLFYSHNERLPMKAWLTQHVS